MTVAELIEQLQRCQSDAQVRIGAGGSVLLNRMSVHGTQIIEDKSRQLKRGDHIVVIEAWWEP